MNPYPSRKSFFIILLSFAGYCLLAQEFTAIKRYLDGMTGLGLVSYVMTYFIVGIPIFLGTAAFARKRDRGCTYWHQLGLSGNIRVALLISGLCVLPMFLGGFIFFQYNTHIYWKNLIAGTIVAAFFEELFFRGFFFGMLFRKTGVGFICALVLGAVVFALGHIDQGKTPQAMLGIFLVTFFGAAFFAWLYAEWHYNLWVPILIHLLMNLAWMLFSYDHTALGSIQANIFRGVTIAIAILVTVRYKTRQGRQLTVNRRTLLPKSLRNRR